MESVAQLVTAHDARVAQRGSMMRSFLAPTLFLAAAGAVLFPSRDAEACGGCFVPPSENTVVTGHRMAVSISTVQSVLWDQIQYAGDPADFSWVLPVKPGAYIEVATDAFFDVLETATTATVGQPPEGCRSDDGGGCSGFSARATAEDAAFGTGGGANGGGVQVVHQGSIGPYDTVTLSAENPNALAEWLEDNGYDLPESVRPTVDAYVEEGFDFIALKLSPDQGVAQMTPVRIVSPGMGNTLPLRMVAAGAGAEVDLVLYVIGEGRYHARDFANVAIDPKLITWDFEVDRSDYAEQRLSLLRAGDGRNWLTAYSKKNAILGAIPDPLGFGGLLTYSIGTNFQFASTIAEAYFMQGFQNGEEGDDAPDMTTCISELSTIDGAAPVVDLCDEMGENCGTAAAGETDVLRLQCGALDDLGVALTGLHPGDARLTRLEAKLPTAALDTDLVLEATSSQDEVDARFVAGLKLNACWDQEDSAAPLLPRGLRIPPNSLFLLGLGAAGLLLASRRLRVRQAHRG
jgi:hypothetical protein